MESYKGLFILLNKWQNPFSSRKAQVESFHLLYVQIMGILNLSPESPVSKSIVKPENVLERAEQMVEQGAEIIEIGGNSSSSKARWISVEEELSRVIPFVKILTDSGFRVSVDTWRSNIAKAAIENGAWMINDINWGRDPGMLDIVAKKDIRYCMMYLRGEPKRHYLVDQSFTDNPIAEIKHYLYQTAARLQRLGKPADHIFIDPGFGFGKTPQTNMEILRNLHRLKKYPLLISASRKKFLTYYFKTDHHDQSNPLLYEATIVFNTLALLTQPAIVRVHDIKAISIAKDIVTHYLESEDN